MNNINALYDKIKSLDVFDKNFPQNLQAARSSFFAYDKSLIAMKPGKYDPSCEVFPAEDGRYASDYKGAHFEMFFKRSEKSDRLIVSFGVARTVGNDEFREQLPVFTRWSWYPFINGSMLCFEDPMYYLPAPVNPGLRIGWSYGNENEDYAAYTAEIIRKIADRLNIPNSGIILYGSSAGGTTAIRVGTYLPGSSTAAINAQLDLKHYFDLKNHFLRYTGIDLDAEDKFHRNDLPYLIKNCPQSKFLIITNAESRKDTEIQLASFLKSYGITSKPGIGLSKIADNTAIWIYDAPGKTPHIVQDNYLMYTFIRYLLDDFSNPDFVNTHQDEVLYITDWRRDQAAAGLEIQQLKNEISLLHKERERLYNAVLSQVTTPSSKYIESLTARIDIKNNSAAADNPNNLKWLFVSDNTAKIQAPLWFLKNGQGYVVQSDAKKITLVFKCTGSGTLEIILRGIHKKDSSGSLIPMYIDYTNFVVDEKSVFADTRKSVWHNEPFKFTRPVKDGEIISVTLTWEEHVARP